MKRFLLRILWLAILISSIDMLVGLYLKEFPRYEVDTRLEKILKGQVNKELIIMGSSRGARDLVASEIERLTGYSSYNLSYPGSNLEFHEFILKTLLSKNKKPKTILLTLDSPEGFLANTSLEFRFDRLYPLVSDESVINTLIDRKKKSPLALYSNIAKLSKSQILLKQKHFSAVDTILACGSMPISFQKKDWKPQFDKPQKTKRIQINPILIKSFKEIQRICREENIRLIIVLPPNYYAFDAPYKKLVQANLLEKTEIYTYQVNGIYQDANSYYDQSHLVTRGALIFSKEVADYLNATK
jgi:hypothetical protein